MKLTYDKSLKEIAFNFNLRRYNLEHLGEFAIPGLGFLYVAGWIGYAGRSYVIMNKAGSSLFAHSAPVHNCRGAAAAAVAAPGLTGSTNCLLIVHQYTTAAAAALIVIESHDIL